jgi:hypothetical protein
MWDWLTALNDGGFQLLLGAALATVVATLAYRWTSDYPKLWVDALVVVAVFVLFAAYPAYQLMFGQDEWHRFSLDTQPSTLTYDKQLWLDLWGVLIGRVAYAFLGRWYTSRN